MTSTDGASAAETLLKPVEVAARLRVSRSTISRWTTDGTLPAVRLGKGVLRYRPADIDALLAREQAS